MDKVFYKNTKGETINLVKSPLIINTKQFREFFLDLKSGNLVAAGEKQFSIPAAIIGKRKQRDKIIDSLIYDSEVNKQGKLYVGDWFVYTNFAGIDSVIAETENALRADLSLNVPKMEWLRAVEYNLTPDIEGVNTGLDFPHDYPRDYSPQLKSSKKVTNSTLSSADFILTFSGEAESVEFSIDNIVYKIASSIAEGETFYLNTYEKTVQKSIGDLTVDLFPLTDDETYIFTKIATGEHTVSWKGDFAINLTVLESRRYPKWI